GTLALALDVVEPLGGERLAELLLGEVPLLVRAELVVGPERELDAYVQVEEVVEVVGVVQARDQLVLNLLARAVDVRVVLDEVPHAQKTVEDSRELVAVQVPRLGEAQGELAVRMRRERVEEAMARAVHRLEAEVAPLDLETEHVLLVLVPVPRGAPDLGVVEERRAHLVIAPLCVLAAAEVLEDVPD